MSLSFWLVYLALLLGMTHDTTPMEYTVLTASKSAGIANGLTYGSPDNNISVGTPVLVPLRNAITEGIVVAKQENTERKFDIKNIAKALSKDPLLSSYHIQTLQWMSTYYCCSMRQTARAFLPGNSWKDLLPAIKKGYKLTDTTAEVRGAKQQAVLECLTGRDWVEVRELKEVSGCSTATLAGLKAKAIIEEISVEPKKLVSPMTEFTLPILSPEQKKVFSEIRSEKRPSLLFGVTGSGKTEIYASLIAEAIASGKSAILLVPEILLTEHCIYRFQELMDSKRIAVLHSRLTPAGRRDVWRSIREGSIDLVIGSRSALFSPLPNLGLVILDEEHEWTYKNEQTPRYHARETAETLTRFASAKLVLGTATPCLESWAKAQEGLYHLARLPERYMGQKLPNVRVIDLANVEFGNSYPFSFPLLTAIENRLTKGEQSVLFLNRRGIASALLCLDCRRRVVSPDSQLPFTVHRGVGGSAQLVDHTTNLRIHAPSLCPQCGSANLREVGAGTQRIEDILETKFPSARILRADRDTLLHPEHMRLLLKKMREQQADILLGTQSVVKGLDLPNVTLAAVLLADIGLSLPHFRAGERIFQLLTQLTGRSGRAKDGEVIIQTFRPDAPEVRMAAEHKTEEYLQNELKLRVHTGYPPTTKIVRLLCRDDGAKQCAHKLAASATEVSSVKKLGLAVSCSPTLFGGGRIWHVLLRGNNPREVLSDLDLTGAVVDIDPMECI
jgi:primosomal protein N' (replication factor Y)